MRLAAMFPPPMNTIFMNDVKSRSVENACIVSVFMQFIILLSYFFACFSAVLFIRAIHAYAGLWLMAYGLWIVSWTEDAGSDSHNGSPFGYGFAHIRCHAHRQGI